MNTQVIQSKDKDGQAVFKILVNGRPHPASFTTRNAAVAQCGFLAQRGMA